MINTFVRRQTLHSKLFLLPVFGLLTACTSSATAWTEKVTIEQVELPKECVGWQKINLKQRGYYALLREDPALIMEIDSHNLKGKNLGCWQ